jgi:hypothetical protein
VPPIATELGLPATADEWLTARGRELDRRLKRFARRLRQGELDGVELRDGRLRGAPVKAATPPEADVLADRLDAMLPRVRITELLHEVSRTTGLASAFTNLRTGESCDNANALLAAILADATNLGLTRMAAASQGVTRDQLIWTADAYIRPETYKAALAKIINAHHALPIAAIWGDGTTSSSDGQFFRSGKRGDTAGEVNARYGVDPGISFYTHVSDQHGPYNIKVMSATNHQIKLVLAAVGRKLLEHGRGRDGAGFQRRDQAPHLGPVFANDSGLDPPAQQRLQIQVGRRRLDAGQPAVGKVPQPRQKRNPSMAQR